MFESSIFSYMRFKNSHNIYFGILQRITATVNSIETKRLLMDLDISMRTSDCPYTVHFFGAMFREGDVMICMEVMDISLDKFYARAFNINKPIPEDVLGKVAYSVIIECEKLSQNKYVVKSKTDILILLLFKSVHSILLCSWYLSLIDVTICSCNFKYVHKFMVVNEMFLKAMYY